MLITYDQIKVNKYCVYQFHVADQWIDGVRNDLTCDPGPIIILVGNKLDQNVKLYIP